MWDPQDPTNPYASTASYGDRFSFVYVDDVRTSQETPIVLHDQLRGELYFLYNFRVSQKRHLWASTACDGDSVTFYM
jgi:hypothetical protein